MSSNVLYKIGARLLGIYFLVSGLAALPMVVFVYDTTPKILNGMSSAPFVLAAVVAPVVMMLAGALLLWFHRTPNSEAGSSLSLESAFDFGLQLLGVYFVVSGLVDVIGALGRVVTFSSNWLVSLPDVVPPFLRLGAGLLLVLCTKSVKRLVRVGT